VFKYNAASHNGGWHDSLTYPAAEDNPLNGNMYRPLYFDGGQAIHGANNVPRSPASHGCARLSVADMDTLINWLGLGDVRGGTSDRGRINLTVNVQGEYVWR
jgi:lipoprotein-anchoring transpeptidase ErfK/SrfK